MSDRFPEKPNPKRAVIMIFLLMTVLAVYALSVFGFFEEKVPVDDPERDYDIIVRFILFFKQSTLI